MNSYYKLLYQSNSRNVTKQTFAFDLETWNAEGQGQQQELQLIVLIQRLIQGKTQSLKGKGTNNSFLTFSWVDVHRRI